MKSMRKTLRLSQHQHTGKIIHPQHTSYGLLVIFLLTPIFILLFLGTSAGADQTIQVSAEVSKDPPPYPPIITSPISGQRIAGPVTISGQCPLQDPAVYVSIVEESNIIGTTTCDDNNGTFSVPISVPYGNNTIYAQVVSFTGTLGHASIPVAFTSVFTIGSAGISEAEAKVSPSSPLLFISGQGVVPFGLTMDAVWRGSINGGTAPYKVHVSWGDSTSSDYSVADQTQQQFQHHFSHLGSYTMIFTVTDSAGNAVSTRVIAVSALPAAISLAADTQAPGAWYQPLVQSDIINAYGGVLVVTLGLWFFRRRHDKQGEKQFRRSSPKPYRHAHI